MRRRLQRTQERPADFEKSASEIDSDTQPDVSVFFSLYIRQTLIYDVSV